MKADEARLRERTDRIVLTSSARGDLASVLAWYRERNRETAVETFPERIGTAREVLRSFPEAGRARNDVRPEMRSYPVPPHVLSYRVDHRRHVMFVQRVLHGSLDVDALEF